MGTPGGCIPSPGSPVAWREFSGIPRGEAQARALLTRGNGASKGQKGEDKGARVRAQGGHRVDGGNWGS